MDRFLVRAIHSVLFYLICDRYPADYQMWFCFSVVTYKGIFHIHTHTHPFFFFPIWWVCLRFSSPYVLLYLFWKAALKLLEPNLSIKCLELCHLPDGPQPVSQGHRIMKTPFLSLALGQHKLLGLWSLFYISELLDKLIQY